MAGNERPAPTNWNTIMDAEEAMERIGTALEAVYAGSLTPLEAVHQIAQIRGAYLAWRAGK
jgi:hypothetical protein